jgi:hypothetical protein
MASKQEPAAIARAKQFIANPLEWPRYPLLPLVKLDGGGLKDPDGCAVMFAAADPKPTIYFAILFQLDGIAQGLKAKTGRNPTWAEVFENFTSRTFESVDALLAEFRVD